MTAPAGASVVAAHTPQHRPPAEVAQQVGAAHHRAEAAAVVTLPETGQLLGVMLVLLLLMLLSGVLLRFL